MRSISKALAGILVAAFWFSACAHYPLNQQSHNFDKAAGYRFDNLASGPLNTDSLFVCLAFSGGGTRAAALAYGVLEELKKTRVVIAGEEKSLLDETDCISSVSGGSFTSAYYGLFRERIFDDFRSKFLERDIQGSIAARLFNPANLLRVASPWFSRIDLAAELYDSDVFDAADFSLLEKNGRPFVILNATNLGAARRFDYTQDFFDAMGSRLDKLPVSRAVAASSAFPFLLSPISLKKYPPADGYLPPAWYQGALDSRDWSSERYNAAKNLNVYLDPDNAYVHLMDGGLSDNLGVRAILSAYERGFIRTRINQGRIKQLVVIVVNARTEGKDNISLKETPPGFFTVTEKTATVAMDNYSVESTNRIRAQLYERLQTQKDLQKCNQRLDAYCRDAPKFPEFQENTDIYVVEINFEALAFIPGEDPDYYLNLPTSFKLDKEQIDRLIAVGPKLLKASPQYQCLLEVLKAEAEGRPRPEKCPMGAGIR